MSGWSSTARYCPGCGELPVFWYSYRDVWGVCRPCTLRWWVGSGMIPPPAVIVEQLLEDHSHNLDASPEADTILGYSEVP
jgi:hypothetical protein